MEFAVRLIEQFLKANNLSKSLETLQQETGVYLNTVDNPQDFKHDIIEGNWDKVLGTAQDAHISANDLIDLYEQIVIELVELQDMVPARALLRQTEPLDLLRNKQPDRYLRLEQLLSRTTFDPQLAYGQNDSKQERRRRIAEQLGSLVVAMPGKDRLLNQLAGTQKPEETLKKVATNALPDRQTTTIKFPKTQHPTALAFSPNYLATGSSDGFIELWDPCTSKLANDLPYQMDGQLMMMKTTITCLCFSHPAQLLASGASNGRIKVWNAQKGSTYKRFSSAHDNEAVTSLAFSQDNTQLLSGGADGVVRIHGLKSGGMLKEFRGHHGSINNAIYTEDESTVISTSEDGSVVMWDRKNARRLQTLVPEEGKGQLTVPPTHSVMRIPGRSDEFVVCSKSPTIYLLSIKDGRMRVMRTMDGPEGCREIVAIGMIAKGHRLVAVTNESKLVGFDLDAGKLCNEEALKVSEEETIGMACHPSRNMVALFGRGRQLPIWSSS